MLEPTHVFLEPAYRIDVIEEVKFVVLTTILGFKHQTSQPAQEVIQLGFGRAALTPQDEQQVGAQQRK